MKVKNDHRSKFSNLSNWKEEAWKNQGFNGIRTRDLRVTGALFYQLSYEATHWERGQPPQWVLNSSIAQKASYSFNWCWWPSVPWFRSEQVSSTRPLLCCSHRSPILWYQKIHWILITQLILPPQTYWVLQGTFRLGWSLICSLAVSRAGLGWRRRSW